MGTWTRNFLVPKGDPNALRDTIKRWLERKGFDQVERSLSFADDSNDERAAFFVSNAHWSVIIYREAGTSDSIPFPAAKGVITKHHSHHYFGFAETQWKLFQTESPRRVKPLLYVYRVLLTGIHLMRTGEAEANLVKLNDEFRLPYIADLVSRKLAG